MTTRTVSQFFPHRQASFVHQNGSQLTTPTKGVEVVLHTRINEKDPCCAELISGDHYAEIGLTFENGKLTDYDGVFYLPREVGKMLIDLGYKLPED